MAKFMIEHPEFGGTYEMPTRYTFGEGRAIEKVTGSSIDEAKGAAALQATIWVAMKRVHPTLAFSDLDEIEMPDESAIQLDEETDAEADPPAGADASTASD